MLIIACAIATTCKKETEIPTRNDSIASYTSVATTSSFKALAATNPGGKISNPVNYSNLNGTVISGLSFDGAKGSKDLITLNSCKNVHITKCRFSNTNGISVRLNNCQNITVDSCFFTMVNFGVSAYNCTGTKVNANQGLNRWAPIEYQGNFSHWIQFNTCNGAGQQVNGNIFEDIQGVAVHPHDAISIYKSSGISSSPIQIHNNWIRGGQTAGGWPTSGDTGVGITAPDVSGSYYEVKNNIVVNSGVNGIIVVATGSNILIDNNVIYNDNKTAKVSYDGFTISGSVSNMTVSNNQVLWLTSSGSYTGYWFGGSSTHQGVTLINNNWKDVALKATILPATIITYK